MSAIHFRVTAEKNGVRLSWDVADAAAAEVLAARKRAEGFAVVSVEPVPSGAES